MTERKPPYDVTAGVQLSQMITMWIEAKRARDELDERVTTLADKIKSYIREVILTGRLDASAGIRVSVPQTDITVRVTERSGPPRLDSKRFHEEYPDLHRRYLIPGRTYWEIRS